MSSIIVLKEGAEPRGGERYAMVVVSARPSKEGAPIKVRDDGQAFFADDNETDVSLILGRAMLWAKENIIERIYVRRD